MGIKEFFENYKAKQEKAKAFMNRVDNVLNVCRDISDGKDVNLNYCERLSYGKLNHELHSEDHDYYKIMDMIKALSEES